VALLIAMSPQHNATRIGSQSKASNIRDNVLAGLIWN